MALLLGSPHSCCRPRESSWLLLLLVSAWPSPGCCGLLENEPADGRFLKETLNKQANKTTNRRPWNWTVEIQNRKERTIYRLHFLLRLSSRHSTMGRREILMFSLACWVWNVWPCCWSESWTHSQFSYSTLELKSDFILLWKISLAFGSFFIIYFCDYDIIITGKVHLESLGGDFCLSSLRVWPLNYH